MKLAIVRVRGLIRVNPDTKKALDLLGLRKSNSCVVVEDSPSAGNTNEPAESSI